MSADKRWRRRRRIWVRPPVVFSPRGYAVDVVAERIARPFICEHHYAGTFPAARLSIGLFGPDAELVGVAVFSVPMQQAAIPAWTGLEAHEGVELGRFVCDPSVAFNGESWFLARCWPLLRDAKPDVRAVLSYADPLERRSAAGVLTKRAHWGTIYAATNAVHAGRSKRETHVIAPDGRIISRRALSKIRNMESGWEYATRQLIAAGAPARAFGESPCAWVTRATAAMQRIRHPGNLVYLFGLNRTTTSALRARYDGGLPYPTKVAA
jgi:hypothetical protein